MPRVESYIAPPTPPQCRVPRQFMRSKVAIHDAPRQFMRTQFARLPSRSAHPRRTYRARPAGISRLRSKHFASPKATYHAERPAFRLSPCHFTPAGAGDPARRLIGASPHIIAKHIIGASPHIIVAPRATRPVFPTLQIEQPASLFFLSSLFHLHNYPAFHLCALTICIISRMKTLISTPQKEYNKNHGRDYFP